MTTKLIYGLAALTILSSALYFGLVSMSANSPLVQSEPALRAPNAAGEPKAGITSAPLIPVQRPTKKARPRMSDQISQTVNNQDGAETSSLSSLQIEKSVQDNQRQVAFGSIRNELNHVMRNGMHQIDIDELDLVLQKLQGLSETDGTVSGVDIAPLRNNLAVIAKINQVNDKIKLEAEKTANQDWSKLNGYVAELQALQKQIQAVTVNTNLAASSGTP